MDIQERINMKRAKMGDVIKDFQASDAPQFKGKSKEKRREMAIAAKLEADRSAKNEERIVEQKLKDLLESKARIEQQINRLRFIGENVTQKSHPYLIKNYQDILEQIEEAKKSKDDPCWDNYEMVGMKEKGGKSVPNCVPQNEEFEQIDENVWNQLGQKKPVGGTLPTPSKGTVEKHGRKFSEGDYVVPHTGPYAGEVHYVTSSRSGSVNIIRRNSPKYDTISVRAKHQHLSPASSDQIAKYRAGLQKEEFEQIDEQEYLDENYLLEYFEQEGIEIDQLTEEQLDELLGAIMRGTGRLIKKSLFNKKGNFRWSTAGRADSLENKARKLERRNKNKQRIVKAQARITAARSGGVKPPVVAAAPAVAPTVTPAAKPKRAARKPAASAAVAPTTTAKRVKRQVAAAPVATPAVRRKRTTLSASFDPNVNQEVEQIAEAAFAPTMKKAIAAHERGDKKKAAYHLGNAKTARYALKSTEISKHKDLLDKYKEMRNMYNEEVEQIDEISSFKRNELYHELKHEDDPNWRPNGQRGSSGRQLYYHKVAYKDKDKAKAEGMKFASDAKVWYHTDKTKSANSQFPLHPFSKGF